MQDSLSTRLVTAAGPSAGRSDGNGPSSSRSRATRSAGTAQISEWTAALTSMHHASAAWLAAASPVNGSRATIRSAFA